MIDEHFAKLFHQMEETRNKCNGLKNLFTPFRQMKTGNHESLKLTAKYKVKCSSKIYIYC